MISRLLFAIGALSLVTAVAPIAAADSFDLNALFCNCIPTGSVGGNVTLTLGTGTNGIAAGDVGFAVHLDAPLDFHVSNAFDAFGFNYIGAGTLTASVTTPNFEFFTSAQGNASQDGAGKDFTDFLDYTGVPGTGNNTGVTDLSFTVHSSSVTFDLTSMRNDFETVNGNNVDFSATVSQTGVSGCTGVIGGGNGQGTSSPTGGSSSDISPTCAGFTPPSGVPEPSSVMLLGTSGLGILIALKRRFGRGTQA